MSPAQEPGASPKPVKVPKARWILLGLGAGAVLGVAANLLWAGRPGLEKFVQYVTDPAGQVWLRALIMIVVPLVFAVLSVGVAELGHLGRLGRMGLLTLVIFVLTSALAAGLGVVVTDIMRPGAGLPAETRNHVMESFRPEATTAKPAPALGIQTLVNIVPRNPLESAVQGDMLGVIFFSLLFGVALGLLPAARSAPLLGVLRGLAEAMGVIIDLVMALAPYGVFALVFSAAARFGFDLLARLGGYVVAVVLGLLVIEVGMYAPMLWGLARRSPREFFHHARVAIVTAFSTSSSNATLPTTLRVSETKLAIPRDICGFVLPLGASMNKNGSALFEAASVVFIAQVLGTPLSLGAQAVVVMMTVLTAGLSNVGVPSAVVPLTVTVLEAVGLPGEGIALVVGVDRFLDMCRTAVNVTGHMVTATIVARAEGGRENAGSDSAMNAHAVVGR